MSESHTPSRSPKVWPLSQFIYLLNAMEAAAQADKPAEAGYGTKRQAVLDYVVKLETAASETEDILKKLDAMASAAYCRACDMAKRDPCLGEEHKIKTGAFTLENLKALEAVRAEFGKAFGLWDAIKAIREGR